MATKSPPVHVLRTVRKLYGLSQQKLANLVGCSLPTIKQIETGRLRPSAGLADRIYMQTGLDPGQLLDNFMPEEPLHAMGMPLSKETFEWMQKGHQENQSQDHVDQRLRHLAEILKIRLDASTRHGKLWALYPALLDAIDKLTRDFDLEKDSRRLLTERFDLKDPRSNSRPDTSFFTIVNAPLYEERRKQAEHKRQEFYELQRIKHGKNSDNRKLGNGNNHEPGRNHRSAA
jgi:transcriptional regulator with XRE-family HTH domain